MAKGWISPPDVPARRAFGYDTDVTGRRAPENPTVHSKNERRYGHNDTTGQRPGEVYVDPVNGDSPTTHHNNLAARHVETVGHHPVTGDYVHPTHPNAEARAAGNAVHTHSPLEPVGQTDSKYGGAHGEPQKRPAPQGNGGNATAHGTHGRHGVLNQPRDRNRGVRK